MQTVTYRDFENPHEINLQAVKQGIKSRSQYSRDCDNLDRLTHLHPRTRDIGRAFLRLAYSNLGTFVNDSTVAQDRKISTRTVQRHVALLKIAGVIIRNIRYEYDPNTGEVRRSSSDTIFTIPDVDAPDREKDTGIYDLKKAQAEKAQAKKMTPKDRAQLDKRIKDKDYLRVSPEEVEKLREINEEKISKCGTLTLMNHRLPHTTDLSYLYSSVHSSSYNHSSSSIHSLSKNTYSFDPLFPRTSYSEKSMYPVGLNCVSTQNLAERTEPTAVKEGTENQERKGKKIRKEEEEKGLKENNLARRDASAKNGKEAPPIGSPQGKVNNQMQEESGGKEMAKSNSPNETGNRVTEAATIVNRVKAWSEAKRKAKLEKKKNRVLQKKAPAQKSEGSRILGLFSELMKEKFGVSLGHHGIKERCSAKFVAKRYDIADIEQMLHHVFDNWESVRTRYKFDTPLPTVSLCFSAHYSLQFIGEAKLGKTYYGGRSGGSKYGEFKEEIENVEERWLDGISRTLGPPPGKRPLKDFLPGGDLWKAYKKNEWNFGLSAKTYMEHILRSEKFWRDNWMGGGRYLTDEELKRLGGNV